RFMFGQLLRRRRRQRPHVYMALSPVARSTPGEAAGVPFAPPIVDRGGPPDHNSGPPLVGGYVSALHRTGNRPWRRLARCAMMRPMRKLCRPAAVMAAAALAVATACAPISNKTAAGNPDKCTKDVLGTLYPGIFTFGTDQPVYPPWYMGDNPASGEGFEAAVAYAVAAKMNYERDDVRWVRVPFNAALAPGPKTFDAHLSEFSITEHRKAAADFSSPYLDVTQAVVTIKSSRAAGVKTVQQLKGLRLGAQVGTTSYTAATSVNGDKPVEVYNTNGDAKMALSTGEID